MIAASVQSIANALFMPWVVAVLLGTGLFLTVRLRFVQFRLFGEAVRAMLARQAPDSGGVLMVGPQSTTCTASTGVPVLYLPYVTK